MRAVVVKEFGGPEQLRVESVPDPQPGAGELLVRVVAAGVNRADLMQRQGHYPPPKGVTDVIGLEVSGHVESVGAEVSGWSEGDPVVALLAGGGYAELVVVPAAQCLRPPEGMDLVSAAGVMEVAATVVSNLDHAHLGSGETFLVHGGAGGIGSFAIPYAKSLGATVVTTAGSEEKRAYCRDLGADVALDYHDDWPAQVREATDGHGADVILDVMGAAYLEKNVATLARDGRLTVIGFQGGRKGTLDLSALLAVNGTVSALGLRHRPAAEKAEIVRRVGESVWPLLTDGTIPRGAERRFAFDEVRAAHEHLESGDATGKLILVVTP